MRTSKAISTISYNTLPFLKDKLSQLHDLGVISFYVFIKHLREDDETKEHVHLYIQPNGAIDSNSLKKEFAEFDPTNEKPLGVIDFANSKFVDWFLYALHDTNYLATKGLQRKYHYTKDELICSDVDYLQELIHTSNFARYKADTIFYEMVDKGYSFAEILRTRALPPNLVNQYKTIYNELVVPNFNKDNNVVDVNTGVVSRRVF